MTLVGLSVSLAEPVDVAAHEMADVAAHEMAGVAAHEIARMMNAAAHEPKVVPVEETVVGCRRLVENVGNA